MAKVKVLSSDKGYNLAAKYYNKKEKYLNSFEKGQLLPLFGDAAGKKILDVGAGTGRLAIPLAKQGAIVTALDVSEEMLGMLRGKGGVSVCHPERSEAESRDPFRDCKGFLHSLRRSVGMTNCGCVKGVIGNAENLPFPDSTFDYVVAAFLIVHLKDLSRFFDEVYRVLKDNSLFLVTNINQKESPEVETAGGKIKIESYYHRPEKVREVLEALAFRVEKEVFVKEKENWVNQIIVARK